MVLELHIWGPAFGLPSIDPQCLAAVCYLKQTLPDDAWSLIPSSNPNICPHAELPALRNDKIWVSGFDDIVVYLRQTSGGKWYLDNNLNDTQQADLIAFSSFIQSRGQPFLDLSLYVSSDNYLTCTRQALGDLLSWPESWTIPHLLRDQAKRRSEHLGLSSLDVDTAQEEKTDDPGLAAHIPKSLRRPKLTVSSLLGRNVQKTRFRLDAVTADFLEPLADALGDNKWLLGDSISSVDCLAIGYLSLLHYPQVPQSWARDALRTKFPNLGQWTQLQVPKILGPSINMSVILNQNLDATSAKSWLPWTLPHDKNVTQVLQSIAETCINAIPGIGSVHKVSEIGHFSHGSKDHFTQKHMQLTNLHNRRTMYINTLSSSIVTAGAFGWLFWHGMLGWPQHVFYRPSNTRNFGEAGSILGLV